MCYRDLNLSDVVNLLNTKLEEQDEELFSIYSIQFTYKTNGFYDTIYFMDIIIFNSEIDCSDDEFDDENGEWITNEEEFINKLFDRTKSIIAKIYNEFIDASK